MRGRLFRPPHGERRTGDAEASVRLLKYERGLAVRPSSPFSPEFAGATDAFAPRRSPGMMKHRWLTSMRSTSVAGGRCRRKPRASARPRCPIPDGFGREITTPRGVWFAPGSSNSPRPTPSAGLLFMPMLMRSLPNTFSFRRRSKAHSTLRTRLVNIARGENPEFDLRNLRAVLLNLRELA